MLQGDADAGIAAIYRRLTDTSTRETHAIRNSAHRALMAEVGSWSPEDAQCPQIIDTNDLRFSETRHAPQAIRWFRAAAARLDQTQPAPAAG